MLRVFCMLVLGVAAQEQGTLVITAGTQTGFFQTGADIGSMNPHDYRPNEFVTNDFIFEGLVAWDGEETQGVDGVVGTDDDFVQPSLAISWLTNYDDVAAGTTTKYEITFTLREGVTFHDGVHGPPLTLRHWCRWTVLSYAGHSFHASLTALDCAISRSHMPS